MSNPNEPSWKNKICMPISYARLYRKFKFEFATADQSIQVNSGHILRVQKVTEFKVLLSEIIRACYKPIWNSDKEISNFFSVTEEQEHAIMEYFGEKNW